MKFLLILVMAVCAAMAATAPFAGWLVLTGFPPMDATSVFVVLAALSLLFSFFGVEVMKQARNATRLFHQKDEETTVFLGSLTGVELQKSKQADYAAMIPYAMWYLALTTAFALCAAVYYINSWGLFSSAGPSTATPYYWAAVACCFASFAVFALLVGGVVRLEQSYRKDIDVYRAPLFL